MTDQASNSHGMIRVSGKTMRLLWEAWRGVVDADARINPNWLDASAMSDSELVTADMGGELGSVHPDALDVVRGPSGGLTLVPVKLGGAGHEGAGEPLVTVGENAEGETIVMRTDTGESTVVDADRDFAGFDLLKLGGIARVKWSDVERGPVLTAMESDSTSFHEADASDATFKTLLARLGAAVTSAAFTPNPGAQLEMSFDPCHKDRMTPTLRINDDVWMRHPWDDTRYYLGRRQWSFAPPFRSPLDVAREHGFEHVELNDVSISVPNDCAPVKIADFLDDLSANGWDHEGMDPPTPHQRRSFYKIGWQGKMWSWSPVGEDGKVGRRQAALSEVEAWDLINANAQGKGVVHHVTRAPSDGSLLELHNAGNGWRMNLNEALQAPAMERPGVIR